MSNPRCDNVLLTPGPTNLRRGGTILSNNNHREMRVAGAMRLVATLASELLFHAPGEGDVVTLAGNGTTAVEAAISAIVTPHSTASVVSNGAYGDRLTKYMQRCTDAVVDVQQFTFGELVDTVGASTNLVARAPSIVLLVESETSAGIDNSLDWLRQLDAQIETAFIIDSVSAVGRSRQDLSGLRNPIIRVGSFNKCLRGIPGASPVWMNAAAVERAHPSVNSLASCLVTNLTTQRNGSVAHTLPAESVLYALDELLLLQEQTVAARARDIKYNDDTLVSIFTEHGFEAVSYGAAKSPIISTLLPPNQTDATSVLRFFEERNVMLCYGQDPSVDSIRVSGMGALTHFDFERVNEVCRRWAASV